MRPLHSPIPSQTLGHRVHVLCALLSVALAPSALHAQQSAFRCVENAPNRTGSPDPISTSWQQSNPFPAVGQSNLSVFQQNDTAQSGTFLGTVTDVNGNPVQNAVVLFRGPAIADQHTVNTNDEGFFEFHDATQGNLYSVTITASGFAEWTASIIAPPAGQFQMITGIKLKLQELRTTVTVTPETSVEIATQQVKAEELQRGFGVIPNFLESYNPHPAPLTWKLKFRLAFKVAFDPVTITGATLLAGANEVSGTPNYDDGIAGFGERFGENYATQFTDTMIGYALLPSLLHQDPRYFYQGTGTARSRIFHAISNVFVTRGDDGRSEPNFSLLGGDLASAAIASTYYPNSNRGAAQVFQNFGINVALHAGGRLLEEFVFHPPSRQSTQPQIP